MRKISLIVTSLAKGSSSKMVSDEILKGNEPILRLRSITLRNGVMRKRNYASITPITLTLITLA